MYAGVNMLKGGFRSKVTPRSSILELAIITVFSGDSLGIPRGLQSPRFLCFGFSPTLFWIWTKTDCPSVPPQVEETYAEQDNNLPLTPLVHYFLEKMSTEKDTS